MHIIQNALILCMKNGKFRPKSKKGINHRVKDFKAKFGKKMPCRNGGEDMQAGKILELLKENGTTPDEKNTLLKHLACSERLGIDQITRVWRDKNKVLCVEYASGCWFHYNGKGEWY